MFRVLETVMYSILITLLAVVIFLLIGTRFELPGSFFAKIVRSGSMEPTIKTGSLVMIRPVVSYSVGDIITFGPDTKTQIPTTHRIVSAENINGQMVFHTKGDANDVVDPGIVAPRDIIGKVIFTVPYAGFILDFARQPIGFALLVGVPAVVIILDEIVNIIHELARRERRKRRERVLHSFALERSQQFRAQARQQSVSHNHSHDESTQHSYR